VVAGAGRAPGGWIFSVKPDERSERKRASGSQSNQFAFHVSVFPSLFVISQRMIALVQKWMTVPGCGRLQNSFSEISVLPL
jgi:hypothetical protein